MATSMQSLRTTAAQSSSESMFFHLESSSHISSWFVTDTSNSIPSLTGSHRFFESESPPLTVGVGLRCPSRAQRSFRIFLIVTERAAAIKFVRPAGFYSVPTARELRVVLQSEPQRQTCSSRGVIPFLGSNRDGNPFIFYRVA